jgi:hypothetical protein
MNMQPKEAATTNNVVQKLNEKKVNTFQRDIFSLFILFIKNIFRKLNFIGSSFSLLQVFYPLFSGKTYTSSKLMNILIILEKVILLILFME